MQNVIFLEWNGEKMADSFIIILRVIINYIVIYVTFRILGKREVKELSLIDLIVFFMIAEIAALSIEFLDKPYYLSLLAIIVLVSLQRGLAYIIQQRKIIRKRIKGSPAVFIAHGQVNYLEMRKNGYSFDDLLRQLREKGIRSISEVDFAILEETGKLSIFTKGIKNEPFVSPLPLIVSGELMKENFKYADIDELDFMTLLHNQGYDKVSDILYANYENHELFILAFNRNEKKST